MSRRYLVRPLPSPGDRDLPGEVARHLAVVRVRPGAPIRLCDGAGHEASAELLELGRGRARARIEAAETVDREPTRPVELAFAVPRGNRAEWLFEHGTELGIRRFRPLRLARSKPVGRDRGDRWRRLIDAAVEQCDRSHAPHLDEELSLAELLTATDLPAARFAATPGAAALRPPTDAADPALWLVGPEGGFDPEETAALASAGFVAAGVGPLTLRVETAALVGCALLLAPS